MKCAMFAVALLLSACKAAAPLEARAVPAARTERAPAGSLWLGKWTGPEGTFLELTEAGAAYKLKIQSLDGPATFDAVAIEDRVEFQRDGKLETIRATNGAETGMKWLLDKKNCLTIKTGEGFCRD